MEQDLMIDHIMRYAVSMQRKVDKNFQKLRYAMEHREGHHQQEEKKWVQDKNITGKLPWYLQSR